MNQRELTFVGGPEDGKRIMTRTYSDRYVVAVLQRLPSYPDITEPQNTTVAYETFTYHIKAMPGNLWVAHPGEWDGLMNETWFERVVRELLRGYVGRG